MSLFRSFLAGCVLLFATSIPAFAVCPTACFWVGGTGTWDNSSTTHWSASSGGAGGVGPPNSSSSITFDGSSGGGTVTVDSTINGATFSSITAGAFTGTLDFSVNNPSITLLSFSLSGSGTRTINLGSGTFTLTGAGAAFTNTTVTNETLSAASSTLTLTSGSNVTFAGGGKTYGTVNFGPTGNGGVYTITASNTIATLGVTAPFRLSLTASSTTTITNAPTWTGTNANPIEIESSTSGTAATFSVSSGTMSCAWCVLSNTHGSGGATFSATNSLSFGDNTGWSISTPGGGGGGGTFAPF